MCVEPWQEDGGQECDLETFVFYILYLYLCIWQASGNICILHFAFVFGDLATFVNLEFLVFALNFCVLDLSRIFGGVIVIWQHLCLSVNEICDRVNIYKEHIILHLLVNY